MAIKHKQCYLEFWYHEDIRVLVARVGRGHGDVCYKGKGSACFDFVYEVAPENFKKCFWDPFL